MIKHLETKLSLAQIDILQNGNWYHTFEVGKFLTPGTYDYRQIVQQIPWPSMDGRSVLDVGCSDGFFSFFFAHNLNAKSVVAVDANPYDGSVPVEVTSSKRQSFEEKYKDNNDFFRLNKSYDSLKLGNANKLLFLKTIDLSNKVNFVEDTIYSLERVEASDVVYCGSLLEHLRDPITALEKLRIVTKKTLIIDLSGPLRLPWPASKLPLLSYNSGGGSFYNISPRALIDIMKSIGFASVESLFRYKIWNNKKASWNHNVVVIGQV